MKVRSILNNEEGFTINELLVVLIVGSLLVGMSLSLFLFMNKVIYSWKDNREVNAATHFILQTIARDILEASSVYELTDTTLCIIKHVGKYVRYYSNGLQLFRDSTQLYAPERMKMTVRFSYIGDHHNRYKSQLIRIKVRSQMKDIDIQAETEVVVPPSSRCSFFIRNSKKKI